MHTATETATICTRAENCIARWLNGAQVEIGCDGIPRAGGEKVDLAECCDVVTQPTREALEAENAGLRNEIKGLRAALTAAQNASRRGW